MSEDHQLLCVTMIAVRETQAEEELVFDYGVENLSLRNKNAENKRRITMLVFVSEL